MFIGDANQNWRGGRTTGAQGRPSVIAGHHANGRTKYRYEHIVVAELALGKPLPAGAVVHHVNGNRFDNRPSNLVICPNQSYHRLLHVRQARRDAAQRKAS